MSTSIRKQVLDEILRILQEELTFAVADGDKCNPIKPSSIIFRKVSVADRDINKGKVLEGFPMIVVSCPFEEPFDPTAGEVGHDVYPMSFLCQIIDRDHLEPTRSIDTYWNWQELISPQFQFRCLNNVNTKRAFCVAKQVDVVDERYWLKEENFKAGVVIQVGVWRTRTWK